MPNYKNGKIYKITNDHNDDIYIGATCDTIIKRFSCHKLEARKEHNKHRPLYKLINEIGFERFRIELIEDYPCEDKYQLRQREGYYIREMANMNIKNEGVTAEDHKKKHKEWYEKNKETEKEKRKEKYKENHEVELEKMKKYREENKEVLNAKKREKVYCAACDCWFSRCGQARHNNRLKHIEAIKITSQEATDN